MAEPQRATQRLLPAILGSVLLCSSCAGVILDAGDEARPGEPGSSAGIDPEFGASGASGVGGSGSNDATDATDHVSPGPNLRLLTTDQYRATLATLFPFANELDIALDPDVALNGLRSIGAANVALSAKLTEAFQQIAEAALDVAFADSTGAAAFVGCDPSGPQCASSFITSFGRRAFRRSLSSAELAHYEALYQKGVSLLGNGSESLKFVAEAMLGSPHFLYRVELGEPHPDAPDTRVLTDVEIASKLAYFLWNGPPDTELLDIAEEQGLRSPDVLAAEALRLLEASAHRGGIQSFFDDYLSLSSLGSLEKLASAFPVFTPSLALAMRQETLLNLERASMDGRDFREVFNTTKTFVNGELAALYGIEGVTGTRFVEVDLPASGARRGLLGQASFLSLYSHSSSTSPTLRGKFVREMLLCQGVPAPPPGIDTTLPDKSQAPTTRDRLSLHATDEVCASCHRLMDPIGLGLENFDAVGRYRADEDGHSIDASGELDGIPFTGPAGLAEALVQHEGVPECFVRSLFRYAWGRLENGSDEAVIQRLTEAFRADSFRVRTLLLETATAPEFLHVGQLD